MGRKKNMSEAELENTQTTLTIEDANQAEAEEAELLAETEVAPEIEEAPKRQRKPRAKKVEETSEVVEATAEPEEAIQEEVAQEEIAPKRQRKPRVKKAEETVEEIGPEPVVTAIDQWAAIKQLSEQVAQILEKNSQVKLPPPQLDVDTANLFRPEQPEPKTLFVTKFAVAASIAAVLLSVVSLSMAQSTRQAVLGALEPIKQSGIALRRSK